MEANIQREVNKTFPGDYHIGEKTSCAYKQNDATVGYVFTCLTNDLGATPLPVRQYGSLPLVGTL